MKKLSEHDEQCMVMDWWAKQYPKHYGQLFSIPNGSVLAGNATKRAIQMKKLKAEGLRAGASDLFLAIPSGEYHGFFIEMKKSKSTPSSVNANQHEFMNDMKEYGFKAEWYAGFEAAKEAIQEYMENGK